MVVILIGFAAGYLSGHFGLGGGLITTPAIRLILGEPAFIAVGTPLLVNIPSALVGAISYGRHGLLARAYILPLAVFGMVGAAAGAALTPWIGGGPILLLTATIIFVMGWRFIGERGSGTDEERREPSRALLAAAGATIGVASGILGLGGGFLLVPFLHFYLGLDIKTTFGTSLAVVGAITIPGAIVHYQLGHIDVGLGLLMAVGVVPGAYIGSRVAMRLPSALLRRMFGFLLVGLALYMAYFEIVTLAS